MTGDQAPAIPAQTITISSDELGREMAKRLRGALAAFTVYRSGAAVTLTCGDCGWWRRYRLRAPLMDYVSAAMEHGDDCPGGPE